MITLAMTRAMLTCQASRKFIIFNGDNLVNVSGNMVVDEVVGKS
jgi:hypothetical protein